jgi:hypothetical protein
VLDVGYAWARTDLSGGEGLDWDPRILALEREQEALDKVRFWDSANIDISRPDTAGHPYTLRLSRGIDEWDESFTDPIDITTSEKYIYIADDKDVKWYPGWHMPMSGSAPIPSKIVAVAAAPNDTVMATCQNGNVYAKRSIESTFTKVYGDGGVAKLAARGVWYVNGRFIISSFDDIDQAKLFTIEWQGDSWGSERPIDTASAPYWSVVESGPAIVAACGDGTLRSYAPESKSGVMDLIPYARTTMPEGEAPILLGSNANVLMILTSMSREEEDRDELRIYQAEVLDDRFAYSVGQMQLRREWLAVEHEPLVTRNMVATRDEIFWFVKEADAPVEKNQYGLALEALWRIDIVTNGLSRETVVDVVPNLSDPNLDPVQSDQINLNGMVIFNSVAGGIDYTGKKIYLGDKNRFQRWGYMIFPNITFGLNTDITWISTVIEAQQIREGGAQVELWRSSDPAAILDWKHSSWVLVDRISAGGEAGYETPLTNLKSKTISLQLRMAASSNQDTSPTVSNVAIRGIPAHRDFIMVVPVDISDTISAPGRRPVHMPGIGRSLQGGLLSLVGDSVEVTMLNPPILFRGIVNNVSEPVTYVADRGSSGTYVEVEFRGQRLTNIAPPTGDSGTGLGLLGISTVGVGQTETT